MYLRQLGEKHNDRTDSTTSTDWGAILFHWQVMALNFNFNFSESRPYISAYALYISCVSLRRYAGRSRDDYEITQKVVLSSLAEWESLQLRLAFEV